MKGLSIFLGGKDPKIEESSQIVSFLTLLSHISKNPSKIYLFKNLTFARWRMGNTL